MKKSFIISLLIFSYYLCFSQISSTENASDTCKPMFKEVFDFQIGDVFQYRETNWSSAGGLGPTSTLTLKYTIINKRINGDTISYSVSGLKKHDFSCDSWAPECDAPSVSENYEDQLIYIDSIDHFLNKCDSSLVTSFNPVEYQWAFYDIEVYTYIKIDTVDNQIIKSYGGWYNLFIPNDEDSLIIWDDEIYLKETYAANIGLLNQDFMSWDNHETRTLEGYIIGGDTSGTITSDENMIITSVEKHYLNDFIMYPNPTKGNLFFKTNLTSENKAYIELYDIRGKKVLAEQLSNNFIDLTTLNNGLYIMKFIIDDKVITKKIIVE